MNQQPITSVAIDFSIPNAARIYDYLLGGTHNTEADRAVAATVLELTPFIPGVARRQRAAMKEVAAKLSRHGFDLIIDFASGLPTDDHLHHHVPEGTAVVYADIDPVVIQYAHEILGDTPNVYYLQADIRQPHSLLGQPEVQRLLGEGRKAALVTWGISLYLSEEDIAALARSLYEWAPSSTYWVFNAPLVEVNAQHLGLIQVMAYYKSIGEPLYIHSLDRLKKLLQPWTLDERGFVSFLAWNDHSPSLLPPEELAAVGPAGGGYSAYLIRS
jgi:hypothetical protein